MSFFCCKSSLDKKFIMAVTGLLLTGFVIIHMLGNLQIFLGPEQLNSYADHLQALPFLLWPARIFLLLVLILHMAVSIKLAIENKKARPIRYAHEDTVEASFASRTMVVSGLVIFAFTVYHLLHFTFGVTHPAIFHLADPKGRHDVYSMVVLSFRDYGVSGAYAVAMAVLCLHLSHGVSSTFQSLGLNDDRYRQRIKWASYALTFLIFIGNVSIPLAALFRFLPLPLWVIS